jgi:cobalamin biosynthesis protein CbiG
MGGDQAMSRIAVGVGCRKGCVADVIEGLVRHALAGVAGNPSGLFTLADKKGETGLAEAAMRLGLPLTFLSREALRAEAGRIQTVSPRAEAEFGVPSVAEASALAGAGPDAVLLVPRIADGGATCAIAGVAA